MSPDRTFIIVGAGLAGAKAAETLRAEGFDGRLLLFGEEPVRPYERPPMSKTYLRGESSFDEAAVHHAEFYKTHDIELHTSAVVASLDTGASQVQLAGGPRLGYERLLLATGAVPRRPNVPGVELEGFHLLRTVADSDAIYAAVTARGPVVVIGAGWIGCEVAASARQLGADVTMIDMASVPFERVLGPEVGGVYRDLHDAHGVKLRLGVGIDAIKGAGRIEEVRLTDGSLIPAGAVVAGIGVLPRTELAAAAGLDIDNGVLCDAHLATERAGDLRGGRRRQRLASDVRRTHSARALVRRPQPGPGRRQEHARHRDGLRKGALLLLGPVRPRHGIPGLGAYLRPRRLPRRPGRRRVHRLLAARRRGGGGHERERVGPE